MDYYYGVSAKEIRKENTLPANRFVKVIKEIFESSVRGKKLTTERRDLLRKWEANSNRRGVRRYKEIGVNATEENTTPRGRWHSCLFWGK